MTAIKNPPPASVRVPLRAASKPLAVATEVPPARPSSPGAAYAAAKRKLVSITGGHKAVALPGETFDLKSLMMQLQAGPAIPRRVVAAAQSAIAAAKPGPTDADRAQTAINALAAPPAAHPRMQHAKDVEERLKKEGLPSSAEGVHVYIVGDDTQSHGPMVARTIGGPIGLAKGAQIELSEKMPDHVYDHMDDDAVMDYAGRVADVLGGSATTETVRTWAIDSLEVAYLQPKAELDYLVAHAPADGQTKVVNMSWGQSEDQLVASATKTAIGNPGSPLIAELDAKRARAGQPKLDLNRPADQEAVRQYVGEQIHAALASPEGAKRLSEARQAATTSVAAAREAGFLPIAAAGNWFDDKRHKDNSRETTNLVSTIPGVLSVGSIAMGDVKKMGDETMGKSSSVGAAVSAPGVGVPVGIDGTTGGPKDVGGTSFAAPYVASVAALMIKANPGITPDQIEQILKRDTVATNVKGTRRDGAGVIDPVAAVREAKALMKFEGAAFHTSQDLDPVAKRAAHDALRKLMPTTTPEFKAAINLINNDSFVELDVPSQRNLLAGLVAQKADPKIAADVTKLAESKKFHELGPAARARFAQTFVTLDAGDRASALALLSRPGLSKLAPEVKDALVAAAAKTPSDGAVADALLAKASEPEFKKMPAVAQAAYFRAFEQQNDVIEVDGSPELANKASLQQLADSPEFKKLDGKAQERWLEALANPDVAIRELAYERLADTRSSTATDPEAKKISLLHKRAGALDAPEMVATGRPTLPGASTEEPQISAAKADKRAVFFNENMRGINSKKADVLVQTVTIEGKSIEVIFPRPMPKDVPSIELIAQGLAGLPEAERAHLQQVIVEPNFKSFMQAIVKEGRPNRVFMGGEVPDNQREMTAMLSHETAHLVARDVWTADPAKEKQWTAAIESDNHWPSNYATTRLQEDVAETVALYYQVKGTPEEATMKRDFPGRYALLKELLGE